MLLYRSSNQNQCPHQHEPSNPVTNTPSNPNHIFPHHTTPHPTSPNLTLILILTLTLAFYGEKTELEARYEWQVPPARAQHKKFESLDADVNHVAQALADDLDSRGVFGGEVNNIRVRTQKRSIHRQLTKSLQVPGFGAKGVNEIAADGGGGGGGPGLITTGTIGTAAGILTSRFKYQQHRADLGVLGRLKGLLKLVDQVEGSLGDGGGGSSPLGGTGTGTGTGTGMGMGMGSTLYPTMKLEKLSFISRETQKLSDMATQTVEHTRKLMRVNKQAGKSRYQMAEEDRLSRVRSGKGREEGRHICGGGGKAGKCTFFVLIFFPSFFSSSLIYIYIFPLIYLFCRIGLPRHAQYEPPYEPRVTPQTLYSVRQVGQEAARTARFERAKARVVQLRGALEKEILARYQVRHPNPNPNPNPSPTTYNLPPTTYNLPPTTYNQAVTERGHLTHTQS